MNVLAQFISREGLPPLVAHLKQSAQQETPAELVQTISPKVPPDAASSMAATPITSGCIGAYSPTQDGGTSDGVFFMRSMGSWSQPVLSHGHCFSVLASGMVG